MQPVAAYGEPLLMPFPMADGSDGRNDYRARTGPGGSKTELKPEEHHKVVMTPSSQRATSDSASTSNPTAAASCLAHPSPFSFGTTAEVRRCVHISTTSNLAEDMLS